MRGRKKTKNSKIKEIFGCVLRRTMKLLNFNHRSSKVIITVNCYILIIISTLFLLFGTTKVAAAPCAIDDTIEGIGLEYPFTDLGKLSIVGFGATVNYVQASVGKFFIFRLSFICLFLKPNENKNSSRTIYITGVNINACCCRC